MQLVSASALVKNLYMPSTMTQPSEMVIAGPSSSEEPFRIITGPRVSPSHSFLPLKCGPPVYLPLPAPYDMYCLTGVLPSDTKTETSANAVKREGGDLANGEEDGGDVDMNGTGPMQGGQGEREAVEGDDSVQREGRRRVRALAEVEGSGGWEYPSKSSEHIRSAPGATRMGYLPILTASINSTSRKRGMTASEC